MDRLIDSPTERRWEAVCSSAALAVPLLLIAGRLEGHVVWRADLPLVRSLGFLPVGAEAVVSTLSAQLLSLLPVGGRLLRAALASAIWTAVASRLVYRLTRDWLHANEVTPRLGPVLALAAAWMATLAPAWQAEGSVAGGASAATALALAALALPARGRDARVWFALGAVTALVFAESHAGGLALLAALAARQLAAQRLPALRHLVTALGAMVGVFGLCLVPLILRPWADGSWFDLGLDPFAGNALATDPAGERPGPLGIWQAELGTLSTVLALGGASWAVFHRRLRPLGAVLVVFVAADALFPGGGHGLLAPDSLAVVRLLALAALAALGALGVHAAALVLLSTRLPLAQPAAVLIVVFNFTVALSTVERSGDPRHRPADLAAEVWTDEALDALPPQSLVLVRSPEIAWRLLSARVVRGERPDLVVVPVPLLARGSVAARLLKVEPGLGPLIREIAVNGRPSEYALSTLADIRPLYIELDPGWDRRLIDHLEPRSMWLGFAPHALGYSDRKVGLSDGRRSFRRVLAAASDASSPDLATLAVLGGRARQQAVALAALGDRSNVSTVVRDLNAIDPEDPFLLALRDRLEQRPRGRVDARDLLQ